MKGRFASVGDGNNLSVRSVETASVSHSPSIIKLVRVQAASVNSRLRESRHKHVPARISSVYGSRSRDVVTRGGIIAW
jgi:hypothetical protein